MKVIGNGADWIRREMLLKPKINITMCGDVKEIPSDIYLQIEPEVIFPVEEYIVANKDKYKYILTYNQTILSACPNARLCLYGTSWITKEDWESVSEKEWLITSITGTQNKTPAHQFRRSIYDNQYKIPSTTPILFYRSCSGFDQLKDFGHNPILTSTPDNPSCKNSHGNKPAKIQVLKKSQFHIAIENSSQPNYFSEKLCDALITKNIPIYYGSPNIGDFFDTTGWILLNSTDTDAVYKQLENLNRDYYNKYLDVINKNFKTVMKYINYEENINRACKTIPELF